MKKVLWAIFLILLMNGIANAENAWVLWKKDKAIGTMNYTHWERISAWPNFDQCERAKIGYCAGFFQVDKVGSKSWANLCPDAYQINIGDASLYVEFLCFPDTIDPRK